MTTLSLLEEAYLLSIRDLGIAEPVREYRFCPPRRFRWDFAWLDVKFAVEINGGGRRGRHLRVAGYDADLEKQHLGMLNGWRCLSFTGKHIKSGVAADVTKLILEKLKAEAASCPQ